MAYINHDSKIKLDIEVDTANEVLQLNEEITMITNELDSRNADRNALINKLTELQGLGVSVGTIPKKLTIQEAMIGP